ncbi:lipocalin-1-like isoform X2 [Oryctolagus cuniculus]|uniref:lipocalin-1-like isoform X2 n=1 Tax=Oryctolagus cuniculus TaxID=9986 RepID=UPI00387A0155
MRLLLLAAGLGLLSALGAQRPPARQEEVVISARSQQLLGRWHIHRWAGTIPFPPEKRSEPLPPFSFVINYNGKLEFRMRILKPSGCQLLKLPFVEYDTGQFSTWWRHPIYIWLVSEGSCGIAYFEDKMNNQDMQMMMLFRHTLDEIPECVRLFYEFVERKGLNTSDIVRPPHAATCKLPTDS